MNYLDPTKNCKSTPYRGRINSPHLPEVKLEKKIVFLFFPRFSGLMAILGFLPVFIINLVCH